MNNEIIPSICCTETDCIYNNGECECNNPNLQLSDCGCVSVEYKKE